MFSLQVFVGQHTKRLASKSSDAKVSKIGVGFGPEGGVDSAWIFEARKRGLKNSGDFGTENLCQFPVKFGTGFLPQNQKSTARSHPSSICAFSFRDCVRRSRTERPSENAISMQGKGRMNNMFFWQKTEMSFSASAVANDLTCFVGVLLWQSNIFTMQALQVIFMDEFEDSSRDAW